MCSGLQRRRIALVPSQTSRIHGVYLSVRPPSGDPFALGTPDTDRRRARPSRDPWAFASLWLSDSSTRGARLPRHTRLTALRPDQLVLATATATPDTWYMRQVRSATEQSYAQAALTKKQGPCEKKLCPTPGGPGCQAPHATRRSPCPLSSKVKGSCWRLRKSSFHSG